ncbi:hypothetical protein LZ30DRAFT_422641 [Colletotrichum cereale]|nr:hypothetical protein LZ30DRAFT_422641 [Colletotrichum cereale]
MVGETLGCDYSENAPVSVSPCRAGMLFWVLFGESRLAQALSAVTNRDWSFEHYSTTACDYQTLRLSVLSCIVRLYRGKWPKKATTNRSLALFSTWKPRTHELYGDYSFQRPKDTCPAVGNGPVCAATVTTRPCNLKSHWPPVLRSGLGPRGAWPPRTGRRPRWLGSLDGSQSATSLKVGNCARWRNQDGLGCGWSYNHRKDKNQSLCMV